jgi:hypothetical protein
MILKYITKGYAVKNGRVITDFRSIVRYYLCGGFPMPDIELLVDVAEMMYTTEIDVFTIACKEIGIHCDEKIGKMFETFYFKTQELPAEVRAELRRAKEHLNKLYM